MGCFTARSRPANLSAFFRDAAACVSTWAIAAPSGAQAQALLSFERVHDQPTFVGLSLGAGLVVFSTITALLHLTSRKHWRKREAQLIAANEKLHQQAERAKAFLASEKQIVIVWDSAHSEPEIEGDVTIVLNAPLPRRVLGFGAWLTAEQARDLEQCVESLRERGEGFRKGLVSHAGRHLEAEGRAIGARAVLRIRDISGDRLELVRLRERQSELQGKFDALRTLLDAAPNPVWIRNADNKLTYVNQAYARAVDARDPKDALAKNTELLDRPEREAAAKARQAKEVWRARIHAVVAGERRLLDVVDAPLANGGASIAADLSELEALRAEHSRQMQSHTRTLDQLATGVAIFDRSKKLVFHNTAYRQLWSLDQSFLDQKPTDSEVLDRLRAARALPEQADYRAWKQSLMASYQSLEPSQQIWHLPGGRTFRVSLDPNPQGGVTYLFDDVTERFNLELQFNALTRVQSETLDTLQEGVAVFGADGRIKFHNPAFARIWRLELAQLADKPHLDAVAQACAPLSTEDNIFDELRPVVAGLHDARLGFGRQLTRADGSIVDCAAAPLPDGSTLLTFTDVTDSVRAKQYLTAFNEKLLAAEQLRADFVHHVSYELRSPLTNIIGFIQLLGDGKVGELNAKQREYIGYVLKSSAALLAIINDILDLASIDRESLELQLSDVDIAKTIKEAAEGVQDRLAESQIELRVVVLDGVGAFRADGKRIRQILFNLLSNAIGFSEPGQSVTLAAMRRGDEIVFKVSDHGRGIPPNIIEKVFERFETNTIGSRHRGVGLGLSIVQSLVKLHHGKIIIDSVEGQGATVTCIFPANGAALQQSEDPAAE